ncbi:hypothetical protein [Catalinimonas niigatensis]|uniref:hypothetical protein n=1 Tax=Catalinimonas niigatensis TaxID=1397264 RepID=UPI0026654531|nr:hypothetical protein [Catalinimonas niigatensis]WPP49486.1 hypothetical protein PZB72_22710 [Catalinimonas niigatensis]
MSIKRIVRSWEAAALDLGIKIQSPIILKKDDNKEIKFDLLIEDFGSQLGTIILTVNDMTDFNIPEKYGYYCSALNPYSYDKYDREIFIDTLTDWGFYGNPKEKPECYQGEIYHDDKK